MMFKVDSAYSRLMCLFSQLIINTTERRQWRLFDVVVGNFEHIWNTQQQWKHRNDDVSRHISNTFILIFRYISMLLFLLLTLKMFFNVDTNIDVVVIDLDERIANKWRQFTLLILEWKDLFGMLVKQIFFRI